MRKVSKCLHTIAACGLIGGLGCYMVLLTLAPQDSPAAYADLRSSLAGISNYLLLPSLAVALVSGLLSMAVHKPFLDKGWAWIKAALGILMFKGVLTIIGAKANHAEAIARRLADGEPVAELLSRALAYEWYALWAIMALSVANVVLGIWRPRLSRPPVRVRPARDRKAPEMVSATATDSTIDDQARPAA